MYFPYLRGKQFELLALRELLATRPFGEGVVPVIEPVRDGITSGLARALNSLDEAGRRVVLVVNPTVGDLRGRRGVEALVDFAESRTEGGLEHGLIAGDSDNFEISLATYVETFGSRKGLHVFHDPSVSTERFGEIVDALDGFDDRVHHVWDSTPTRHLRQLRAHSRVVRSDNFKAGSRNADYIDRGEAVFSEDHLYYREDGYAGFGDFLTIGQGWVDGGFSPRVVAIHWTYCEGPDYPVMIRHFTSDSNVTTADVAGKFLEAAAKLVSFCHDAAISTVASDVMRDLVSSDRYPGLGVVKKLSIMNHLELIDGLVSE